MTGFVFLNIRMRPISLALIGTLGLAACTENGEFAFPSGNNGSAQAERLPANALNQRVQRDIDVERPDIFAITDNGLWDGRPSLGGVWVAYPEVTDPERVVIRNTEGGQEVIGALFRRERQIPGPRVQVSSDAAEALGILPGSPTRLEIVVLRRKTVEVDESAGAEENPVVASLQAPVAVEEAALEPAADVDNGIVAAAATAAIAVEATTTATETATATADAVVEAATDTSEAIDVSSVLDAPAPLPAGSNAQVGVYSVEANAANAVEIITTAGIEAHMTAEELGGRTVWRVIAGPLSDTGVVARLREMGFVDAFVIETAE